MAKTHVSKSRQIKLMGRVKQLKPRDLLIRTGPHIKKNIIEKCFFKLFNTIFQIFCLTGENALGLFASSETNLC